MKRTLWTDPYFIIGAVLLGSVTLLAIFAPLIAPYDPLAIDMFAIEEPPSATHLLGTDEVGRDVLSRLLFGARVSVLVGLSAVAVQLLIGVTLGALAGYFGGITDAIIMRLTEIVMCFPFYAMAITLAALFGASLMNVVIIIGLLNWTGLARLVRGEFLSLREREFVQAAKAIGVNDLTIIIRHLLRNAYGPVMVYATLAGGETGGCNGGAGGICAEFPWPWGAPAAGQLGQYPVVCTKPACADLSMVAMATRRHRHRHTGHGHQLSGRGTVASSDTACLGHSGGAETSPPRASFNFGKGITYGTSISRPSRARRSGARRADCGRAGAFGTVGRVVRRASR
ncbi:binding-protein-dependent transport systems inner membrane component [Ketogulonicigenium vulgare Y25]|uniref:ABC transporter permease n=1 Tax=Ketogulonicigenium vulgare TaxID=92945 RepID=UPI0001E66F20|nr:ABC transporter permease [Ketogulonicigenium vulgare]ADO43064.1 binding-protein-dependent transport systems inner membrane component [Ketogulonicigenium vulgare Y25]